MSSQPIEKALHGSEKWQVAAPHFLEAVGEFVNAKRVGLFQVEFSPDTKTLLASLIYEWSANAEDTRLQDEKFQAIPMKQKGLEKMLEQLENRQVFVLSDENNAIEPFLSVCLGAMAAFPLHMKGKLWGYITVESAELDLQQKIKLQGIMEQWAKRIETEHEIEEASRLEKYLAKIQSIVDEAESDHRTKIEKLLALGLEAFNLDVAIVSHIVGQSYTVKYYWPLDAGLEHGQVFELGQTYCSITLRLGAVVGIPYVQESPYRNHPCYQVFQLVSYFGVQLRVRGKYYGTVNFSSPNLRKEPYTDVDRRLLRQIAEEIGKLIED